MPLVALYAMEVIVEVVIAHWLLQNKKKDDSFRLNDEGCKDKEPKEGKKKEKNKEEKMQCIPMAQSKRSGSQQKV